MKNMDLDLDRPTGKIEHNTYTKWNKRVHNARNDPLLN